MVVRILSLCLFGASIELREQTRDLQQSSNTTAVSISLRWKPLTIRKKSWEGTYRSNSKSIIVSKDTNSRSGIGFTSAIQTSLDEVSISINKGYEPRYL